MTCIRCAGPLCSQIQKDRGLCGACLTGSSLSALVALAASQPIQPPIYFAPACRCGRTNCITHYRSDFEGLPKTWPSDTAWKTDVFGDGAIQ